MLQFNRNEHELRSNYVCKRAIVFFLLVPIIFDVQFIRYSTSVCLTKENFFVIYFRFSFYLNCGSLNPIAQFEAINLLEWDKIKLRVKKINFMVGSQNNLSIKEKQCVA